jgi:hypothetical protein
VPSAVASAESVTRSALVAASADTERGEAQHGQVANWRGALLPDSRLWIQALVTSPFPTWPHLAPPLETNRLGFALSNPDFRAARVGTRSCDGPRPCRALVLPVTLRTVGERALELTLATEPQGGPFPWTPIHGCSKRLDGPDALLLPWVCGPLYLAGDTTNEAARKASLSLHVTSTDSSILLFRLDWSGTGSLSTPPLIANAPGTYALQIFVLFEEGGKQWVSPSQAFEIRLE